MFKPSRWRSDKLKIKAVFELQFQATQVPIIKGKKKVMISIVPESVGRPTVKLPKTSIVEGTCLWENPVYETIKLIKDTNTGIFKEYVYHFIVSTGSSKSGYLGEVSVDFAEFAEATQPLLVSLPLNFTDSGAVLNIGIRKMQENEDKRDGGKNEDPKSLKNQLADPFEDSGLDFLEDDDLKTSPETERSISFNDRRSDNIVHAGDSMPVRWNSMPPNRTENEVPRDKQVNQPFNTDWSVGSASDKSLAEFTSSPAETFPRDRSLEAPNNSVEWLKNEVHMLERQAELSELELQSLRKQIAKEGKRGQDLSRQVVGLKEENGALKKQYEQLKTSKGEIETKEVWDQPEDMMQRLRREKDLNKKLRSQLYETEDSNSELILVVNDLNKKLEQKSTENINLSNRIKAMQNVKDDASETSSSDTDLDTDKQTRRVTNNVDKANEELLKQITDLCGEIEMYRKDKDELKLHMEALVLDYDTLKQEKQDISTKLEQNQILQTKIQNEYSESLAIIEDFKVQMDILEKKINKQDYEFSKSLNTIEELESMVKNLEEQLEKQAREFEDDLDAVTQAKVKQEQRAIRAEEALRKTRWSNASSAERLQEEFKKLSLDMTCKLDENEKKTNRIAAEADDLRLQKSILEQMLQKAEGDLGVLKDQYEGKVHELSNEINLQEKQIEKMSRQLEATHSELASVQKLDTSTSSSETFQTWNKQREEHEKELALATKAVEILKEELTTLKTLKDEKGILVGSLQSEMENQNIQYNELKQCMLQIDLEKETLRKHVSELEGQLKKKDEVISSLDKRIQSKNEDVSIRERTSKVKSHEEDRHAMEKRPSMSRRSESVKSGIKNISDKKSNCDASDDCSNQTISSEVALLKERNKQMEEELKEMQDKYSEISLKFAEVEGERQQLVMSLRNLKNGKKK